LKGGGDGRGVFTQKNIRVGLGKRGFEGEVNPRLEKT